MTLSSIGIGASPVIGNEEAKIEPTYTTGDVPLHTNEEGKSLRASSDGGDHELPVFPPILIEMERLTIAPRCPFVGSCP